MKEYHKIQTLYERDPATNLKKVLRGEFALPAFEYLARNEWTFTEKVDGTNIRVMIDTVITRTIIFGGKTDAASIPATLVSKLNERFLPQSEALFAKFPDGGCLYGEGYGAKIQKGGGNYRPDQSFVLFDVKVGDWWLERSNVEDVAQALKLDVVPIIGSGDLYRMTDMVAAGFVSKWGDFLAEGIVARPKVELKTRGGDRVITKLKRKDF